MKPTLSKPVLEPNTCFMRGTKTDAQRWVEEYEIPLEDLENFTPGWSYTDYAKIESKIIPVELRTTKDINKHFFGKCRCGHYISCLMQLSAVATMIAAFHLNWYIAIASGLLVVLYILENRCSSTASYLQNIRLHNKAHEYIRELREAPPDITFNISCYHTEIDTREVKDSDGEYHTELVYNTVTTHEASEKYKFDVYKDYTNFPSFTSGVIKMKLKAYHCFEDPYTKSHFEDAKETFIRSNKLDTEHHFWLTRSIPGMKNRVLLETQPKFKSTLWTPDWFCCSIIACWAPCYRLWFLNSTGEENVRVTKSVQKIPPEWYRREHPELFPDAIKIQNKNARKKNPRKK